MILVITYHTEVSSKCHNTTKFMAYLKQWYGRILLHTIGTAVLPCLYLHNIIFDIWKYKINNQPESTHEAGLDFQEKNLVTHWPLGFHIISLWQKYFSEKHCTRSLSPLKILVSLATISSRNVKLCGAKNIYCLFESNFFYFIYHVHFNTKKYGLKQNRDQQHKQQNSPV